MAAKTVSIETRRELLRVTGERYREASRPQKQAILDEFVAVTGYHRKHAIRVLLAGAKAPAGDERRPPRRLRVYDDAVRQALIVLWEASDRVCGKRLRTLIPILLPALERHGHLPSRPGHS